MSEIIPILGSTDRSGKVWTMDQTVGVAIGASSSLFRNPETGNLDGMFDEKLANRIRDELMANIDQFANERVAEHIKNQDEKRKRILGKKNWHDSQDAMVWAEKFVEMHIGKLIGTGIDCADEGFMVSWFANAMAAATRPFEADDARRRFYDPRLGLEDLKPEEVRSKYETDHPAAQADVLNPESEPPSRTIRRRMIKDNPQA